MRSGQIESRLAADAVLCCVHQTTRMTINQPPATKCNTEASDTLKSTANTRIIAVVIATICHSNFNTRSSWKPDTLSDIRTLDSQLLNMPSSSGSLCHDRPKIKLFPSACSYSPVLHLPPFDSVHLCFHPSSFRYFADACCPSST